jgi:hypothetical protein
MQEIQTKEERYTGKGKRKQILCKNRLAFFTSPAGMSLTKLSLAGNNSIFPGQGKVVSDIPPGDGETANPFFTV